MSLALDGSFLLLGWAYVFLAPYTKVEESFNLHATHDVYMYGISPAALSQYDHFVFPGAVPRTFVGSVLLAWLMKPVVFIALAFDGLSSKSGLQMILRLTLSSINGISLILLRRAVSRHYGRLTGLMYTLLSITQFHIPFWMGRTLPNMFALPIVNLAYTYMIPNVPNATKPQRGYLSVAIGLITFAIVVFRAELLLLLAPISLQALWYQHITLPKLIRTGILSGFVSLVLTVAVDSYFWQRWPLWPEFSGIYFNVYENKSVEWGVSPPLTYVTSLLPKLLMASLPLSLPAILLPGHRVRGLLIPIAAFIAALSSLGHKEWRFIIYVVPIWNIAGARGAAWMLSFRKRSLRGRVALLIVIALLAGNVFVTIIQTRASMANYPGGEALKAANIRIANSKSSTFSAPSVHLHLSNLAAQTGASLFLQENAPPYPVFLDRNSQAKNWTYDKVEGIDVLTLTANRTVTHVISEFPCAKINGWKTLDVIQGFESWPAVIVAKDLVRRTLRPLNLDEWKLVVEQVLKMQKKGKLCIMERV